MIPDYQTLMRPVLQKVSSGEIYIGDVIESLAEQFQLTEEEREELLPSGKQAVFASRVHWAKTYLKQAGLVKSTRRAHLLLVVPPICIQASRSFSGLFSFHALEETLRL